MKTTIYINSVLLDKLKKTSMILNISKNEIISMLLSCVVKKNNFKVNLYKTVKYQDSHPNINWKIEHVDFEPVFYEKAQALRRNFKLSVSWLISFAIINYLDDILEKSKNSKNYNNFMDNYDRNFVYIAKIYGRTQVFITMLGLPEGKYLEKLII